MNGFTVPADPPPVMYERKANHEQVTPFLSLRALRLYREQRRFRTSAMRRL
jgi:hypothetical protein